MKSKRKPDENWRDDALLQLSKIARKIENAKALANQVKSSQFLVELDSALMMVNRLRSLVSNCDRRKPLNWNAVIEAIVAIGNLVEKFNTFFNCKLRLEYKYESRFAYQTSANSGRCFANLTCS